MGAVIDRRGPGGQERFYINMTKPPFDDIRVRKAFMHAIDRKAIKETMYPGRPGAAGRRAACPPATSATSRCSSPSTTRRWPRSSWPRPAIPNGITIKNYFISKSFFYPKVLTLAQEQLKKVGINVELQVVEHATYHENIRKNLNPFVLYGGTRITDADPWLSLFFDSKEIPDPGHRQQGHELRPLPGHGRPAGRGPGGAGREEAGGHLRRDPEAHGARPGLPAHQRRARASGPRNPKRVSTPFDPEYGEFSLHYSYNYPGDAQDRELSAAPMDHQYIVRRVLMAIPMLLGAMSIVFFAMRILPGDPCVAMMGDQATTEALADCTKNLGLDRPLAVQYADYIWRSVRFDFGNVPPPGLPGQRVHRPHVPAHVRAGHRERRGGRPGRHSHRDRLGAQAPQPAHRLSAAHLRPARPLHAGVLAGHPPAHRVLAPPRHLPAHRRAATWTASSP